MSVSVALLLPVFASVEPAPAATVAVLIRSPVASGLTMPLTVSVIALPAPGATLAPAKLTALPEEPFVPQLAMPVTAQLAVTPVIAAGTVSVMLKPSAVGRPGVGHGDRVGDRRARHVGRLAIGLRDGQIDL